METFDQFWVMIDLNFKAVSILDLLRRHAQNRADYITSQCSGPIY